MSKQEKLAALIEAVRNQHFGDHGTWNDLVRAISDYDSTPDDPPQPPEMPECVMCLVEWAESDIAVPGLVPQAVRDHYRQPLKLEVGRVYEDEKGDQVRILWEWPDRGDGYSFLGAYLYHRWCCEWNAAGIVDGPIGKNLIREVANG